MTNMARQKKVLIMAANSKLKWITIQMAKVKKTLGSVSKNNDHGVDAVYSCEGAYLRNRKTDDKTPLRRQRGVFVMDTWAEPFEMVQSGKVTYLDANGRKHVANVRVPMAEGFSRPE